MPQLEWTRPAALVTLLLPALVLLLSLRKERPHPISIGTFSLWKELPAAIGGEGHRRRIPPERMLVVLALVCGGVALAGPRRTSPPLTRTWLVVVDGSPSMYLDHPSGGTRLDAALSALDDLAERGGATLRWSRPSASGDEEDTGDFPSAWLRAPWPPRSEPAWSRYDSAGTVWLTDRAPPNLPALAGVVASGGPAVEGPIGSVGNVWLDWDGEGLVERSGAPSRTVELDPELPTSVLAVARAWAAERGFDGGGEEVALTVGVGGESVTHGPGRVSLGRGGLDGLSEDPAAFAVYWSELFDKAVLPPVGTVSLAERGGAGESLVREPIGRGGPGVVEPRSWPVVAILSAVAAGLGFLALAVGRGRL